MNARLEEIDKLADLFGYDDDSDLNRKEYVLAILMLLGAFDNKYSSKSITYFEKHFEKDLNKLEDKILRLNEKYFYKYVESMNKEHLLKFNIPSNLHNKVNLKLENIKQTLETITTTIKNIFNEAKDSIKLKIKVWKDRKEDNKDFNYNPTINKIVKRTKEAIKYGTNMARQKSERAVESFVYGENARFKWVCYGKNPCDWCLMQQKKAPRPLKDIPFDHVNGYCGVEPADETTSKAYNELLGI